MNNSNTPKIVVGVGLVAVYGALTFFMLHGAHDSAVAQSLPAAVSAPTAAEPAAPPVAAAPTPAIQESVDTRASTEATAKEARRPRIAAEPKPHAEHVPVASLASTIPPARNEAEASSTGTSGSNAVDDLPPTEDAAASASVTSAEDVPQDKDNQAPAEVSPLPSGN
jgi:hypothetical protein